MKVKETIVLAAEFLGEEYARKVRAYLEEDDMSEEPIFAEMLDIYNQVQEELASEYIPLRTQEEIETETGAVNYSVFSNRILQIVRVTDEWGMSVRYDLYDEYFKTRVGRLKVTYTYLPRAKGYDDEVGYDMYVTRHLFAYGIAARYCLKKGLYDEAEVWDRKYKASIRAAYKKAPCKKLPQREWK